MHTLTLLDVKQTTVTFVLLPVSETSACERRQKEREKNRKKEKLERRNTPHPKRKEKPR